MYRWFVGLQAVRACMRGEQVPRQKAQARFLLSRERVGNVRFITLVTIDQPGQVLHLLPTFLQGTLQLVSLAETGLYLGESDSVDYEGAEVHPGVPVAVKRGGIVITRIP